MAGEEIGLEVDRDQAVPEGIVHLLEGVARVVGGVVHEHGDGPVRLGCRREGGAQGGGVGEVAGQEKGAGAGGGLHLGGEGGAVGALAEGGAGALSQERLGQGCADAGAAAGDEDRGAGKVREGGMGHGGGPWTARGPGSSPGRRAAGG